jgi:phospholipid transport system substrate-binding protein
MWKLISRYLALGAIMLAALSVTPARAADEPAAFIQNLGDQAILILQNKQLGQKDREVQFNKLFTEGFDVAEIGRFVLGRYWNVASPEQQQQYQKLFATYVVAVYANRFSQYSGEKFTVAGSQAAPDGASVASQIIRPNGGPPINIVWKIAKENGGKGRRSSGNGGLFRLRSGSGSSRTARDRSGRAMAPGTSACDP